MYLKVYANHMKGVQVKTTINLQCNSPSQIHSSVYLSADTNLAEIHEETSELLDKQVNV